MNDSMKTLLAFLAGAAAGAVAGILLAPDKGSETRKKILSKAKDLGDGVTDAAKEKYDEFMSWKDSILNGAEETAKQALSTAKNKVTENNPKSGAHA